MTVLVITDVPGGTAEQDKALVEALNLDAEPPQGARARLGGPTEGGWRIIGLWDSREAFDTYLRDRVLPAMQAAGRSMPATEFWTIESVAMY
jgi:hypothetical protein